MNPSDQPSQTNQTTEEQPSEKIMKIRLPDRQQSFFTAHWGAVGGSAWVAHVAFGVGSGPHDSPDVVVALPWPLLKALSILMQKAVLDYENY